MIRYFLILTIFYHSVLSSETSSVNGTQNEFQRTPRTASYMLYKDAVNWNRARNACIQKGGHLAIIRSRVEEDILLKILNDQNAMPEGAWIGIHDQFQYTDWVTVLDEPLKSVGYIHWADQNGNRPDNAGGNQHCARLIGNGVDDLDCPINLPYLCQV